MAEIHGKAGNITIGGQGCAVTFTASSGGLPAFGSVTVANPGAGYAVGNVLAVTGGTGTLTVGAVNGAGGITAFSAGTAGAGYTGAYTGQATTLSTGATVSGMSSWTIKTAQGAAEVTNFSDAGVKRYIPGEYGWSGSFSGNKTGAPINILAGLFTAIFQESATSTQQWSGQILVTDISTKVDAKGVVQYGYSFTGSGALAQPTT